MKKTLLIITLILLLTSCFKKEEKEIEPIPVKPETNIQDTEEVIQEPKVNVEIAISDKELEKKLSELDVIPLIKDNWEAKKEDSEISRWDEELKILSFTNISQCETLKFLKNDCNDSFLHKLAIMNGNTTVCNKIINDTDKIGCKNEIYYNKKLCDNIDWNLRLKVTCLKEVNKKKKLETDEKEKEAIMTISKKTNKYEICEKLSDFDEKIECLKPIIIKNRNIYACNDIFTKDNEKDDCIKNMSYSFDKQMVKDAFRNKDLSICEKIYKENTRTKCTQMSF